MGLFSALQSCAEESCLSRLDSAVENSITVSTSDQGVWNQVSEEMCKSKDIDRACGYLLIHERKNLLGSRSVAPIPHEIHGDGEHTHQSDTGTLHATVGIESELVVESAGSISVGEDGIASFDQRQGQEGSALLVLV